MNQEDYEFAGQIEAKEEKSSKDSKVFFSLKIDGKFYSAWDEVASIVKNISAGSFVKGSYTAKGKYKNIKTITTCTPEQATQTTKTQPPVNNQSGSNDHRHKGIPKINAPSDKAARSIKFSLKDKTILDVGASNCVNFLSLKKYHNITPEQYYALELDNKALRIGKEIGVKNIIHHYFDKNILKKINRTFDLVIATEVLEHQVNPKEFIDTAFKVLKKNGILVLTIPNKKRFFLKYREQPGDVPPHHFLRFDKAFFIKNFKKEIVHVEEFHNRQTTFKETSKSVAKKIFKNQKLWVLASPLTVILRIIQVVDIIKGDKLLVIMKKG